MCMSQPSPRPYIGGLTAPGLLAFGSKQRGSRTRSASASHQYAMPSIGLPGNAWWISSRGKDFAFRCIARPSYAISLDSIACRSEEHTSELQSLMRISYAVFCLKKKNKIETEHTK